MTKLLHSKAAAWCAMILVLLVVIFTFRLRTVWWAFIDEFFMFMAVFCQLVACYIHKYNKQICKKLQTCSLVFLILMLLAFIGEYIAYQFAF